MVEASQLNGVFILLAITGGFLPTIFWLWFWLQEDRRKPEPMRLIVKTFIIGGFSVALAFWLEQLVTPTVDILSQINTANHKALGLGVLLWSAWPLGAWALIEEFVKYLAAYIAALKNKNCDEPMDMMIYLITTALGFAAVENVLFLFKVLLIDGVISNSFLLTGNLRFLGSTLLHVVTSAIFGAALGLTFYRHRFAKTISWFVGLSVATVLHASFNFFIIIGDGENVLSALFWLWLAAMFVILIFEVIKRSTYSKIINNSL